MSTIEQYLDSRTLSHLSPKARAELLAVAQVRFKEPFVHQLDRRSWGAIDWTLRPAEGASVFVFGKRLPAPFGKHTLELEGNATVGDKHSAQIVAVGDRDRGTAIGGALILAAGAMGSLLLLPLMSSLPDGLGFVPLLIVYGLVGLYLWRAHQRRANARSHVHTHKFKLTDPLAELIRIDVSHPDPRNALGDLIRQAVMTPDLARLYVRMAGLIVEIHADLDRYPIEVVGSIRNGIVTLTEALPQTARDCERAIMSLESVLKRLDKLDRAHGELGVWAGGLSSAPTSDAALSEALRAIDRETQSAQDLLRHQKHGPGPRE